MKQLLALIALSPFILVFGVLFILALIVIRTALWCANDVEVL